MKNYCEEINHPWPAEITEQHDEEKNFPTGPVYDDYESDPWESQEEEPEEQQEEQFISCSEPVREQPSPEISQPASTSHPPVPTRDIHPCVSSCVAEKAACYKFPGSATHSMSLSMTTWSGISFIPWSRPILSQLQPLEKI
jgi:hypothetical protein